MNLLTYLQFALALPKRNAVIHYLYRRAFKAYAWWLRVSDPEMTINQFLWGAVAIPIGIAVLLFTIITIAVS